MGWCPGIYIGGYLRQNDAYGFVVIFLFQEGRSMNVAVSSVLTAAELMACLVAKSMVFSW